MGRILGLKGSICTVRKSKVILIGSDVITGICAPSGDTWGPEADTVPLMWCGNKGIQYSYSVAMTDLVVAPCDQYLQNQWENHDLYLLMLAILFLGSTFVFGVSELFLVEYSPRIFIDWMSYVTFKK